MISVSGRASDKQDEQTHIANAVLKDVAEASYWSENVILEAMNKEQCNRLSAGRTEESGLYQKTINMN